MSQGGGTGRASPYPHTETLTNPCRPENLEENPRSQQRRCSTLKKYKIKDYSDMVKKGDLTVLGSLLTQFSMGKKNLFLCVISIHIGEGEGESYIPRPSGCCPREMLLFPLTQSINIPPQESWEQGGMARALSSGRCRRQRWAWPSSRCGPQQPARTSAAWGGSQHLGWLLGSAGRREWGE